MSITVSLPLWRSVRKEEKVASGDIILQVLTKDADSIISLLTSYELKAVSGVSAGDLTPITVSLPAGAVSVSKYILEKYNERQKIIAPRKLSEEEINDILDQVPDVMGAINETITDITKGIKNTCREQLRDLIITPLGISELKDEIVRRFERSRVNPGMVVGIAAAESIGAPTTQMSLNTFHSAGSSKNMSGGIEGIRELINGSANRKVKTSTIHYTDRNLTFEEVLLTQGNLVSLSVGEIVKSYDVDLVENMEPKKWTALYLRTLGIPKLNSRWMVRIVLNTNLMFSHRIKMSDIVSVIQNDNSVWCVPSPLSEGILDIYPDETKIRDATAEKFKKSGRPELATVLTVEMLGHDYIQNIILPEMASLIVKRGLIPGLKKIYPTTSPIWKVVKDEVKDSDGGWLLHLDRLKMKSVGISIDDITELLRVAEFKNIQKIDNYIVRAVVPPLPLTWKEAEEVKVANEQAEEKDPKKRDKIKGRNFERPGAYIQKLIELDDAHEKQYEETEKKKYEDEVKARGGKPRAYYPRRPPTEISRKSKYAYAEANGENLRALLSRDDIDATRTITNNLHDTANILGIEAARNHIINSLIEVISVDGSYINPRHIVLIVDFMTNRGEVKGVTFSGVSRQPTSTLTKSSYEQAMKMFTDAATTGVADKLSNVSASIFVGQRPQMGTGAFGVGVDKELLEREEELLANINKNVKVDTEDLNKAIDEAMDVVFATGEIEGMSNEQAEAESMFG